MLTRICCILRECVWSTDRLYDYVVPDSLVELVRSGVYVEVPFGKGNRCCIALVIGFSEAKNEDEKEKYALKEILRVVDTEQVLQDDQLELLQFIRYRYTCTYGDALRLMVPAVVSSHTAKTQQVAFLLDRDMAENILAEGDVESLTRMHILEALLETDEIPVSELMQMMSVSRSPIDTLKKKGLIGIEKREIVKKEEPPEDISVRESENIVLNAEQREAVEQILQAAGLREKNAIDSEEEQEELSAKRPKVLSEKEDAEPQNIVGVQREFLLYGVTGSGKTEVYLHCAREILENGGNVLFLVPEISLTPQMINWIKRRLDYPISILHSRLTPSEKYEQWDMIRKGISRIIIGARSAVFAPIQNLKLILMDEEQDSSYKSETHPRYHARDIARQRAKNSDAVLVLGSATPAVESFYAAKEGYSTLLRLSQRASENAILPDVSVVDMRKELKMGNRSVFSLSLQLAMEKALRNDEQIILFLNKRGYSGVLLCRDCGESVLCEHCSVSMHLHIPAKTRSPVLACHYCGKIQKYPDICPACNSKLFGKIGIGTQQLEEMTKQVFPAARVLRMDQDSTASRGAHERILNQFRNREADILIGTQMIAKGHDFPKVTVVGILSADILLNSSGFRAQERGFQLLTQAAGRAGRDELAGQVFFQTYHPEDDTILYAAHQDYERFFDMEIMLRKRLLYPPFKAAGSILVSHSDEEKAGKQAKEIRDTLISFSEHFEADTFQIFEIAPAPIYKLKDKYRYRILMKSKNKSSLSKMFRFLQDYFWGKSYFLHMDIDPD